MAESKQQSDPRIAFMQRVRSPDIPALAFKLAWLIAYQYMNHKTGTAFPAQDTLAKDLACDIKTVRRAVAVLRPLGLATEGGRGRGNVTVYRIKDPAGDPGLDASVKGDMGDLFSSLSKADTDVHLSDKKADTSVPFSTPKRGHFTSVKGGTRHLLTNIEEPIRKNPSNETHPAKPAVATKVAYWEIDAAFEEFWKAYPRKVEKKGAWAKYATIIKRGEATVTELLAGAKAYAECRAGGDPKFTKHPTTWLSNGCWNDERTPTAAKPNGSTAPDDAFWRERVKNFLHTKAWAFPGPKPGERDCKVPQHVLDEFGIRPP